MSLYGGDRRFDDHREALEALTEREVSVEYIKEHYSHIEDIEVSICSALAKRTRPENDDLDIDLESGS